MTLSTFIAALATCIAGASLIALRLCWLRLSEKLKTLEQQIALQQAEISRVNKVAIGVGRQVLNLQQENKQDAQNPQGNPSDAQAHTATHTTTIVTPPQDEYLPYSQANELLNNGESLESVQQKCRLSKAETELLALMQTQDTPTGSDATLEPV